MDQQLTEKPHFTQPSADDEISLKDIILKIKEWFSIVWPHRVLIILLSLVTGLTAALYTKFSTKPTYTASYQLFFQEESSGLSGAMRLASSFGLGGMGGGSASSSAAVQAFITSRNNIAHVMTVELENGRLIDRYYAVRLEENEEFKAHYRANFGVNKRYTDSVLTQVFLSFNQGVLVAKFDKETGVLGFSAITHGEAFTYDLATQLVQNTEAQFMDWKRQKGLSAINSFQGKVDSLKFALDVTLRRFGEYQDQNKSLISAVDKMEQMRLTIDMEALKVAYGEYIKALEMSKAELINLEGPFKYFDEPIFPLEKTKESARKAGIFGAIITGFLLVLFFIGRVEAKNIMAD